MWLAPRIQEYLREQSCIWSLVLRRLQPAPWTSQKLQLEPVFLFLAVLFRTQTRENRFQRRREAEQTVFRWFLPLTWSSLNIQFQERLGDASSPAPSHKRKSFHTQQGHLVHLFSPKQCYYRRALKTNTTHCVFHSNLRLGVPQDKQATQKAFAKTFHVLAGVFFKSCFFSRISEPEL